MSKALKDVTAGEISGKRIAETGVLVDVEQMHPSDVMTLKRRVEAANMRITAECTDLRAAQYGPFDPGNVLQQYKALEREIATAKALIFKAACIVVVCLCLVGCCESGVQQSAPESSSASAPHCTNGKCYQ